MAVDPLLRDPLIDRTMDLPAYRAHRILLPWIAYAVGLGKPAWIVQVFALENVFVWLAFALLLCRWMPPTTARGFVLWTGCLLSHGMLSSVRYALPDAPSTLLIALAVLAAERDRPLVAAAVIGVASLARETSLLAASVFLRWLLPERRRWLLVAACLILCVLPLALWLDYLRSIYRLETLAGTGNLTTPLVGLWWKLRHIRIDIAAGTPGTRLSRASRVSPVSPRRPRLWCARWSGERRRPPGRSSRRRFSGSGSARIRSCGRERRAPTRGCCCRSRSARTCCSALSRARPGGRSGLPISRPWRA